MLKVFFCVGFFSKLSFTETLTETTNNIQEQTQMILDKTAFEDLWGFNSNWTNLKDGWTKEKRKLRVTEHFNTIKQSSAMKAFTKLGYKKMKIPAQIHQKILQHKKQKPISTEACSNLKGFTNCESINSNGISGKSKCK